jgi:hypothetical protein
MMNSLVVAIISPHLLGFSLFSAPDGAIFHLIEQAAYSWRTLLDQSEHSKRILDDWGKIFDILSKLFTMLALVLGAIVGYFKFVKGRIYLPRIEPTITGKFAEINGIRFALVEIGIKNVGISKISLDQSSGLDVCLDEIRKLPINSAERLPIETAEWQEPKSFRVFQDHKWIESGETIREEKMFAVSDDVAAAKLSLQAAVGKITATAMKIIVLGKVPGDIQRKEIDDVLAG